MKKLFTKSLFLFALFLFCAWNVNAQTSTYSGTFPITLQGLAQSYTAPLAAGWAGSTSAPTASDRSGKCFTTATTDLNFNTGRNITYRLPYCGTITLQANGTVGRGFIITVTKVTGGAQVIRTVWAYGTSTCSTQSFVVNVSEPVNVTILSPSAIESPITAVGSSYISYVNISSLPSPTITAFVAGGVSATINESSTPKTITAVLPYGTTLTSITPNVTYGGSATGYSPVGAQDFSASATTPVIYSATDATNTTNYSVTLTASLTPSSAKDLSAVTIGGYTPVFNALTNTYSLILPKAASLTQAVSFTNSIASTTDFTSGSTFNFTTPLTITVTAQDNSTKLYTLQAVNGVADIAYVTVDGAVGATDTQVYPDLVSKGYFVRLINAATGSDITQFNSYDLTVLTESPSSSNALATAMSGLVGVKPFLSMKAFMYGKTGWPSGAGSNGTADLGANVLACYLNHPVFSGVTFTGNTASILNTGITGNGIQGVTTPGAGIVMANLPSLGTAACIVEQNSVPAAKYLLIPISTVNFNSVNASGLKLIENAVNYLLGSSVYSLPSLEVTSFTVNTVAATINNTAGTITAQLPISTDLSTLQPTIVLTGASTTISPLSGVTTDFTNSYATPINYTVTDGCNSKVYAVTISVSGTGISTGKLAGVSFDGQTIHNDANVNLQVFDTTGRLVVSSTKNINMSSNPKGVYIVKNNSCTFKIVL